MPEPVFFQHFEVEQKLEGGLHELGRGAMGITYKAFDTNLQCPVALKIINAALTENENARERFLREARAAARLRHPNVATVLHLGRDDQTFFYAMEFIEGETLESHVQRCGPFPPILALEIVQQVARALGAAQNEGLVHRDIKPANLMLVHHRGETDDEGVHVKVIDFGLAKFVEHGASDSLSLTMAGGFVGSPYFASPEQVEGSEIDTRSDIYSLGATLWYLLLGEPPFTGSLGQVLSQHLQRSPPYQKFEGKAVPPPVLALLRRLLAKSPDERPSDPAALRREISACLKTLGAASGSSAGTFPAGETVVAGHFALGSKAGSHDAGQLYEATDRRDGRKVRVLKIVPGLLDDPAAVTEFQRAEEIARSGAVPGLVRVLAFERAPLGDYLVTEMVDGFTLLDVLRARGEMETAEGYELCRRIAEVLDAALAAGLRKPAVTLRTTYLRLDNPASVESEHSALPGRPLAAWPPYELRLEPLELQPKPAVQPIDDVNAATLLPEREPQINPAGNPAAVALRALAEMVYELLGGKLPAPGSSAYPPLSRLPESANEVLRSVLTSSPADARYKTARSFAEALAGGAVPPRVPAGSKTEETRANQAATGFKIVGGALAGSAAGASPRGTAAGGTPGGENASFNPLPGPQIGTLPPVKAPMNAFAKGCLILGGLIILAIVVSSVGVGLLVMAKHQHRQGKQPFPSSNSPIPDTPAQDIRHPDTPEDEAETPEPNSIFRETPPPAPTRPPPASPVHISPQEDPLPTAATQFSTVRPWPVSPNGVRAVASYRARLSARDHRSSSGTRLNSAADILRQDRANYHQYHQRDPEDEGDPVFANAAQRAFFDRWTFPNNVSGPIVNGTPYVQVDVYPNGVTVSILSP